MATEYSLTLPPRPSQNQSTSHRADELLVDELRRTEATHLAANPAVLHPAERQLGTIGKHHVDVNHARIDLLGDAPRLLRIAREHVRAQPERGTVRDLDRLLLARHPVEGCDRSKELLPV